MTLFVDGVRMPENTIKLGVMPPLSGLVGIYGTEISRAAHIACQEVNENGGVLGRRLEVVIEDDGSMPESAVVAAEKLVDEHHCVALIGNLLSNSRIAVAYRVAEPRKIPLLNFSFYEGSILSRYFFHFAALPNQQIDQMIPYMKELFGPRMFFAGNNYEWPRGSIYAGKHILERVGGVVVGEEYCPIGVELADIENLLDKVEAAAPDVFVPYFAGIDQVNLLTRFTERGLKNKMSVVMGHYDEMMASQLSTEIREGFYSSNTYFMSVDTDENRTVLKRLENYPGIDAVWPRGNGILTNFGEGTYACVKAFAQAANEAGNINGEALVEVLKNISISSAQGILEVNPNHHHAKVNTYLSRCNTEGEFEIIKSFGAIEPVLPDRYRHQKLSQKTTMEDDIRLQARMLDQMFEAVFLVSSQDNSIIYSNAGAERTYGYAQGEMQGLSIFELNDPLQSHYNQINNDLVTALNQKGEWKGEISSIKKQGERIWCSVTGSIFTHPVYGEVWLLVHRDITERKQVQAALAASEEQLRLIHSRVPGIVYQLKVDTKGNKTLPYVSPNIENYLCITSESAMIDASSWFDLTHPSDLPSFEASIVDSMRKMTTWDWTGRFVRDDGQLRWLHGTSTPEKLLDGSILWNGVYIDISEQKQAEIEVEQSAARFEAMFESIPDAIIYADSDRIIQMINSAAKKLFGYTKTELIGQPTAILYTSIDEFKQQGQKRYNPDSSSKATPYQISYKRKTGQEFRGETLGTPVRSSNGEVLGYLGIIRDVTEKNQVDAILQSLAEGASGIQFKSFMNDALERLTDVYQCGYAFIGKLVDNGEKMEVLSARINDKFSNNFECSFAEGIHHEYKLEGTPCKDVIEHKNNLVLHDVLLRYPNDPMLEKLNIESYYGAPLVASDGTIIGILAVMDTRPMVLDEWTEPVLGVFATRAAMELEREVVNQELQQHREHLEELVDERSVELIAAVKEAKQANASKSEFLSSMSHELRTPMNAILGFGQLLEMDNEALNETQRENVNEILEAGDHLLTLINEVLDLAKIESGNLKINIEMVPLSEPLAKSLKLIKSQAAANKLTIVNNISPNDYIVQADDTRLKQVLLNLLSNAVKYNTHQGSITLDSEVVVNQRLRICVTDTGKGLTKAEIAKLFTAFERLDAVDNVEGTGIGLVISKHLIELMDGSIGIKSKRGKGSTFWIELPLAIKN